MFNLSGLLVGSVIDKVAGLKVIQTTILDLIIQENSSTLSTPSAAEWEGLVHKTNCIILCSHSRTCSKTA